MSSVEEAYKAYKVLEHWQPVRTVLTPEELADKNDPLYPLFEYLYEKTKQLYTKIPKRKNGEESFIHPLNVVWDLRKAHLHNDVVVLCIGMLHDYIEEVVDLYKKEHSITETKQGKKRLDTYEIQVGKDLEKELVEFCTEQNIDVNIARRISTATKLLTKHKRHFYYKYISQIFSCEDIDLKEIVTQVKLADRTHNILSIECFSGEERLYQCFKNFFILNNAKQFLLQRYGPEVFLTKQNPTERLFNKCAKATYDAFLTICHLCFHRGIGDAKSMIQLAFKKFAYEKSGLGKVTEIDWKERHPLWLFQGIIWKFDARLHHEWEKFELVKAKEKEYCKLFFSDFHFNDDQIQGVIDYKDAYALKEALARVLYLPNYIVSRFLTSDLTNHGRIKRKK